MELTDKQNQAVFLGQLGRNLLITGPGGGGKSVVVDTLRERDATLVVGPTATAAVNVCGSTAHSVFRLPRGVATKNHKLKKLDMSKPERLIIDEAFMLRGDYFSYIDRLLQFSYMDKRPFAGCQIILVGDGYQIPPIITDQDYDLYSSLYKSPYFFDTESYKSLNVQPIILDKGLRQDNEKQQRLLESIRVKDQYWKHAVQRVN